MDVALSRTSPLQPPTARLPHWHSFLFSADRSGCIKVWDLNTGQIAQTIDKAHNETISQMLMWEVRGIHAGWVRLQVVWTRQAM
eukprot:364254-Chlamydomonas_euryale.AAC.11